MKRNTLLADLDVLFLDFQATAANPENGCLTEIGWLNWRASQPWESVEPGIVSHLCQLPGDVEIPRRVTRVTGLKTGDLQPGLPVKKIWKKLLSRARKLASARGRAGCLTVIHYSRYEEPYLNYLHQKYTSRAPFPFDIICTHQVVRRLLPGLPRKSLRAIAGYFGHSVPELRRSGHHIAATAFIWRHLVQLLAEKDINTLDELKEWLKNTPAKIPRGGREYLLEASLRLNLPKKPGVYRMSRSNGDLLYIGKATSLKHRVNSYFQKGKRTPHANHIMEMLTQAAHLEVIVTGSALEAALLEADEIKRHSPPYNIALRHRDREILFFSKDLREPSPLVDATHPLGPLPTGKSIPTFAAVDALLKGEFTGMADTDVCLLTLGIPPEYAPETECFWQGVEIFRQRHKEILKKYEGKLSIKGLMMLGKLLRHKKLQEMAAAETAETAEAAESGEESGDEANETEETTLTPEGTADIMEGIIRHGAHLIRRSRWFCLLSESSLAWKTGKSPGENRRLLVFQGGSVLRQEDMAPDAPIPSPAGFQKTFTARQQNFDLITYDRMRVLTTELRRIAADEPDRQVQLCLSPKVVLERQQLLNLLKWI